MSTEDTGKGTSSTPSLLGLLVSTTELVPPMTASPEKADPLLIIIALVCIFLLVTFFIIVTICKPQALDQSHSGPREFMPHHPADPSEPQLRLWKRLGSLRCSINTFRRSRPVSHSQPTCTKSPPTSQDWDIMESTKM